MSLDFDMQNIHPTTEMVMLAGLVVLAGLIVLAERKVTQAYTVLHVIGGLAIIPAFFLMLRQKYQHDIQWAAPAFMLAAWGNIAASAWREFAPPNIMARWDGYWLTASPLFYAIIRYLETGNTFCVFFSVFGAPTLALTLGYFIIGRYYNERNTDLARYPHMAAHYEREDAKNRAWWCEVGKNAGILAVTCILGLAYGYFMLAYGFKAIFFLIINAGKIVLGASILGFVGSYIYFHYDEWKEAKKAGYKHADLSFMMNLCHFAALILFGTAFVYMHTQAMALVAMNWAIITFFGIVLRA